MSLFQLGHFTLASGDQSNWKIDCDALDDDDWAALAWMLLERLSLPFDQVLGVPRGGEPFAEALNEHVTDGANRLLIVDDVWTTGGSMRQFTKDLNNELGEATPLYDRAVVFARGAVVPATLIALFRMSVWP